MDGNYRNTAYLLEEMACIQVNTKKMFYFKEGALTSVLSILDISLKLQCLRSILFQQHRPHCEESNYKEMSRVFYLAKILNM